MIDRPDKSGNLIIWDPIKRGGTVYASYFWHIYIYIFKYVVLTSHMRWYPVLKFVSSNDVYHSVDDFEHFIIFPQWVTPWCPICVDLRLNTLNPSTISPLPTGSKHGYFEIFWWLDPHRPCLHAFRHLKEASETRFIVGIEWGNHVLCIENPEKREWIWKLKLCVVWYRYHKELERMKIYNSGNQ